MDINKLNALQDIKKRDLLIVVLTASLVSFFCAFLFPNPSELVSSDTLKYLGSALIQSFAALIAIPFAFYASYLYNKYGYAGLQFAVNKVKEQVFPLFALVAILSILLIMYPDSRWKYDDLLGILLSIEFFISTLLLLIIYRHLIEVMTVTPSKLAKWVIFQRKNKNENTVPLNITLYKSKMISELLIRSLEDPTLHQDSEEVIKQLLELLDTYHLEVDESLDLSTEAKILTQLFGMIDPIITTLKDSGQVISRDAVEELVKVLSEIYFQFLIRRNSKLSNIDIDISVFERVQRLHKTFYNIITRLSLLYSANFYKVVYHNMRTLDNTELLIENTTRLIENTSRYLKISIYSDQKEDFAGAPRTSAAISDSDFIFELLPKLKEEEIERVLSNSREELIEIITTIKDLLIPPVHYRESFEVTYLASSGKKEPIHIDNKNIALKLLLAWTRCILIMAKKISEYKVKEQHLDHTTKRVQNIITGLVPGLPKHTTQTELILKEILIENIVKLYEEFECNLTFDPESEIVVFGVKKLGSWYNIGLVSEKFNEIYDYLQSTRLQKYLRWKKGNE